MTSRGSWIGRNGSMIAAVIMSFLVTAIFFLAIPVFTNGGFIRKTDLANEKVEPVDTDAQYDIAIHEAGHVIVNVIVRPDREFDKVFVRTSKRESDTLLGLTMFAPGDPVEETLETLRADTLVDYAGEIAREALLGNEPYTKSSDFKHAKSNLYEHVRRLCANEDACAELLTEDGGAPKMMKVVVSDLEMKARERAKTYVEANRDQIIRLANLLMRQTEKGGRRTLGASEIKDFLAGENIIDPEKKPDTTKEATTNE